MKKVVVILICLCLFLAVSCSKNEGNEDNRYICTLVTYDGTVFKNLTKASYLHGTVRGYLPDGSKVWANGNWYVIRENR